MSVSRSVSADEERAALAAVHDMLGPDQQLLSVEKNVVVREEEVLLVNGTPIALEGEEGVAIKECLLKGAIPNQDLINHLLIKAGLLIKPVKVSTELTVTNTTTHSENIYLHKNGEILDEKCKEKKETNVYSSAVEEDWLPISDQLTNEAGWVPSSDQLTVEAGKSLRDRLQSTDSINIGNSAIDDSIDLDVSLDSCELKDNLFVGSSKGSSVSINSERSGGKSPNLVYKDGVIMSGTLEEPIHELLPRAHSCPADSFMFSFLLSSRLYLTPSQLIGEVYRRADQLVHMMSTSSYSAYVTNLLKLLSNWLTWFPYDFQVSILMKIKLHITTQIIDN